jgi:hypothetical protein
MRSLTTALALSHGHLIGLRERARTPDKRSQERVEGSGPGETLNSLNVSEQEFEAKLNNPRRAC